MSIVDELIVGASKSIIKIRDLIEKIASSGSPDVFISGESGTGKSLVARAIHESSKARIKGLLTFDCGATSQKYLERELFGFQEKAPTIIFRDRGLLETTNSSTVLFENIHEAPLDLQRKLLRLVHEKTFSPVGSKRIIQSNFRFLATSQVDIEERLRRGFFREDFFYRLNVISIKVPPLRDRPGDLKLLIQEFVTRLNKEPRKFMASLERTGLMRYMENYSWPGNVAELKQLVESLVVTDAWETVKDRLLGRGQSSNRLVLERSIKFPPEYHQAGVSIMSFFGEILRRKYPDQKATVRIEQDELKVRMIIEPILGEPEIFERALDEYGLVLTGKMTPEEFSDDPFLVINLKHELRMAQARIEAQKELLGYQDRRLHEKDHQIDKFMGLVGQALSSAKPQYFTVDISPTVTAVSTIKFDVSKSVTRISDDLKQLKKLLQGAGDATKVVEAIQKEIHAIDTGNAESLKKAPVMQNLRKFIEKISDTEGKIGKVLKTIKLGTTTVQKLARHYNDIAQWCGLPQVPKPFLGSEDGL